MQTRQLKNEKTNADSVHKNMLKRSDSVISKYCDASNYE